MTCDVHNAAFYGLDISPSERRAILAISVVHTPNEKDTRTPQDINDELHRACVRRMVRMVEGQGCDVDRIGVWGV